MRSDYETVLARRGDVLKDLQAVSRRANSVTPVLNPEDLGIIRNTIGPALNIEKFGRAWSRYIEKSPTVLYGPLLKEAGFWDWVSGDLWGGLKDVAGGIGGFFTGVGSAAKNLALAPYNIYKGIEGGATSSGPWYSRVGRALGGAVEGAFRPVEDLGGAVYQPIRGTIKGVGNITNLDQTRLGDWAAKADPWAEAGFRYLLPAVGLAALPGGQVGAAARIAGTGGRLSRMGSAAGRVFRMAEVPAGAANQAAQGGRAVRAIRSLIPTSGEMSALGQTARGVGTAAKTLVTNPSLKAFGDLTLGTAGTTLQATKTLGGPAMLGGLAFQMPEMTEAWQQGWRPWGGSEQQVAQAPQAPQTSPNTLPTAQVAPKALPAPKEQPPAPAQPEQDFSRYLGGAFQSAWQPMA